MSDTQTVAASPADRKPYARPTLTRGPLLSKVAAVPGSNIGVSDIRLKRDVRALQSLPSGLTLYRYRYRSSDVEMVGVMAQDVLKVMPAAVLLGDDGYFRVDYDRLGLRSTTYAEWLAERPAAQAA